MLGLVVLLLVALCPAAAQAAEGITGEILSVGIGGVHGRGGIYRMGTWVPVRVRLENHTGATFEGALALEQVDLDGDRVTSLGRNFVLEPTTLTSEPRDFWFCYWPRPDDDGKGITSVAVVDKNQRAVATVAIPGLTGGKLPPGDIPGVPAYDGANDGATRLVVILGQHEMGFGSFRGAKGGDAVNVFVRVPSALELPETAQGLDGIDTIIWNTDEVRVSDVPADFQLKAILEWVRQGGHLILVTGDRWQDLADKTSKLHEALPADLRGAAPLPDAQFVREFCGAGGVDLKDLKGPFTQAFGDLRPRARSLGPTPQGGAQGGGGADPDLAAATAHPLAMAGAWGAGSVTLVTVNLAAGDLERPAPGKEAVAPDVWLRLWQKAAGWRGQQRGQTLTLEQRRGIEHDDASLFNVVAVASVGDQIPKTVDVSEETSARLLLAILFLGLYWILAGPGGHLVLKYYRVPHWSWWIFGATVVAAAGIAIAVVTALQFTGYELRHKTYLMGNVGEEQASVTAFFGLVAPTSNAVALALPDPAGPAYLAPMDEPTNAVKPFADPRYYTLHNASPWQVSVPYRRTLKKLQARWDGRLGALVEGEARYVAGNSRALAGTLVNHTGVDLSNVQVIFAPATSVDPVASAYIMELDRPGAARPWRDGETLSLQDLQLRMRGSGDERRVLLLGDYLQTLARRMGATVGFGTRVGTGNATREENDWVNRDGEDFLGLFAGALDPGKVLKERGVGGRDFDDPRLQVTRYFTRSVDRTASLQTLGAVLIARSGASKESREMAPAPLPLKIDGRENRGKGEVVYSFGLKVLPAEAGR